LLLATPHRGNSSRGIDPDSDVRAPQQVPA